MFAELLVQNHNPEMLHCLHRCWRGFAAAASGRHLVYASMNVNTHTLSILHRPGVLPTQVVGVEATAFSLAIMNSTVAILPDEAATVAKVLKNQLKQVRGSDDPNRG